MNTGIIRALYIYLNICMIHVHTVHVHLIINLSIL